jgi:hypothetical protein
MKRQKSTQGCASTPNANLANTYNCVILYVFKPDQIRSIRDVWMRRMPADRDQVWIRLPAKLKPKP